MTFILIVLVLLIVVALILHHMEQQKVDGMSPTERRLYLEHKRESSETLAHGPTNAAMVCPHCQTKGKVRTKVVDRKKGISGGKATAAILTGGVSMLATGLSRKAHLTRVHCGNCNSEWDF